MITAEEVKKLASLARLELKAEEAEKLRGDLNRILDYVGQIKEVQSPEAKVETGEVINRLREDNNPRPPGEFKEKLLAAAPERSGDYFRVKKILQRD